MTEPDPIAAILAYHRLSKHRPDAYAPGPGYLDWANQPDPFRRFAGCPQLPLALGADGLETGFDALFRPGARPPASLDRAHLGLLLELSLGLAAWKSHGGNRWALRCNPSSGNLHPTEGYLVCPALPELEAGVLHYQSHDHCLEQRLAVSEGAWNRVLDGQVLLGLSSIAWREAWKYGARAFRYCQLDAGHALAALRYAAAALGWQARLLTGPADAAIAALLGLDREADFSGAETESPELLLAIGPAPRDCPLDELLAAAQSGRWQGRANRLSSEHREWPQIPAVEAACRKPETLPMVPWKPAELPPQRSGAGEHSAAELFRRRRSAQAFAPRGRLDREGLFDLLDALLPRAGVPPWDALPWQPALHPMLFLHQVDGIEPGLYALPRGPRAMNALSEALRPDWLWEPVEGAPEHLPLRLLLPYRLQDTARQLACLQEIAGDSCLAFGMLADFRQGLERGPHWYRYLYWEAGVLGQSLYLQAEALGLRGTGIGCFFDDPFHQLLGLEGEAWQILYMFTLGQALEDRRLGTEPPYAHLG